MSQLRIEVTGNATIYRPAERAIVYIRVDSEGASQEEVSKNVAKTSSQIRDLLTNLAGKDPKGHALSTAALTHWSNSSLSTGSHIKHHTNKKKTRVFTAGMSYEAKFQDFTKLGSVTTMLSTMEHVSVDNIEWRLTEKTKASLATSCRYQAVGDAVAKARDFAAALDRPLPAAVEVRDSGVGVEYGGAPAVYSRRMVGMAAGIEEEEQGPELNFSPENVSVECSVFVVFESKA